MHALDDNPFKLQWQAWGQRLRTSYPQPRAILLISAHWLTEGWQITTAAQPRTIHDFGGFPAELFALRYPAPGSAAIAQEIMQALPQLQLRGDGEQWGLDHGAWTVLMHLFPQADIPVLQLSMPTLDPQRLFALGERLAPLRDEGVLIVGSGFTTHNLAWFNPSAPSDAAPPTPSAEFDHWPAEAVGRGDVDAVLDFLAKAPAAREAHPRTEHWAPLYVALGAASASGGVDAASVIDGFWYGLSKRSWQFA